MNTLAISQLSTLRWSFEQDAQAYTARGFKGIGIYRPKLEDFGLDRTPSSCLAESSLSVTSLSWVGGFTGSDGRAYRRCRAGCHERRPRRRESAGRYVDRVWRAAATTTFEITRGGPCAMRSKRSPKIAEDFWRSPCRSNRSIPAVVTNGPLSTTCNRLWM